MFVVLYPSVSRTTQAVLGFEEKVSEQTATIRSGSLETIEVQTRAERWYEGLPNLVELERQQEAMSVVAMVAAQSMLQHVGAGNTCSADHKPRPIVWMRGRRRLKH